MKDTKEFGIKYQEMQSDLEFAQKRLREYIASEQSRILKDNIGMVIPLALPMTDHEIVKVMLEKNIKVVHVVQKCTEKIPGELYSILQDDIPKLFFEMVIFPTIRIHAHPTTTIDELMRYDPELTQKEPVKKDHSFKEVKKRNEFFRRR